MIKLGKLTDYAIVLMGQLAKEGAGASRSAQYLADKTGVPAPTVAKVLKNLTRGNFVVSVRGPAGGYRLLRDAKQISLAEIITAMEGPITVVSCIEGSDEECKTQYGCPVKRNWSRVNGAIKDALEGIKLAEMITPVCGQIHVYMRDAV